MFNVVQLLQELQARITDAHNKIANEPQTPAFRQCQQIKKLLLPTIQRLTEAYLQDPASRNTILNAVYQANPTCFPYYARARTCPPVLKDPEPFYLLLVTICHNGRSNQIDALAEQLITLSATTAAFSHQQLAQIFLTIPATFWLQRNVPPNHIARSSWYNTSLNQLWQYLAPIPAENTEALTLRSNIITCYMQAFRFSPEESEHIQTALSLLLSSPIKEPVIPPPFNEWPRSLRTHTAGIQIILHYQTPRIPYRDPAIIEALWAHIFTPVAIRMGDYLGYRRLEYLEYVNTAIQDGILPLPANLNDLLAAYRLDASDIHLVYMTLLKSPACETLLQIMLDHLGYACNPVKALEGVVSSQHFSTFQLLKQHYGKTNLSSAFMLFLPQLDEQMIPFATETEIVMWAHLNTLLGNKQQAEQLWQHVHHESPMPQWHTLPHGASLLLTEAHASRYPGSDQYPIAFRQAVAKLAAFLQTGILQSLLASEPQTGLHIFLKIAGIFRQAIALNNHGLEENLIEFGTPRVDQLNTPSSSFSVYGRYHEYIRERLIHTPGEQYGGLFLDPSKTLVCGQVVGQIPTQDGMISIPLTTYRIRDAITWWIHTDPCYFPPILQHAGTLLLDILTTKSKPAVLLEKLAHVHWWLAHAAPAERGSAAMTQMIVEATCAYHGYAVLWTKYEQPDCWALINPVEAEYCASYHTLCQLNPLAVVLSDAPTRHNFFAQSTSTITPALTVQATYEI